ncbi:cytochrome P450 [Sporormia fimetaria CBS 119925]|uniref:Cytochrome P450 n=1 Tax=Sporormia fimetaria CBS 119925 TaxID=1340428 RepID=A0A6A6VJZ3_9PLEO|nr:cytochrome P450 [Sporormia fimetaria CBS 119925]
MNEAVSSSSLVTVLSLLGSSQTFVYLLSVALLVLVADYTWILYRRWCMPPGPFPWPIVGNTFSLPDTKPWYLFEKLSQEYNSPVITFWIGRNPTVWVNDAWSAHEMLVEKASIYTSRPRMLVFAELGIGQYNLLMMYTFTRAQRERFRAIRKLTHLGLNVEQVKKYQKFQDNELKIAMRDLLVSPDDFVSHFERYATSVVSIIGYGRRTKNKNDPILTEVMNFMKSAAALNVPGKSFPMLMETFPFLAKFPNKIAPWKYGLGSVRESRHSIPDFFLALAIEANSPDRPDNYSKLLFQERERYNLHDLELSQLTANLLGGGADTSSSTLATAVLAMRAFPEACRLAQSEIDRVVGPVRSPNLSDRDNLPYVRAFVKEVFRWRTVAIIGGQPHAPTEDTTWNGYRISKGTWVQGNTWAIHHNSRDFPEPDRFDPSRFLGGSNARPFPTKEGYMTFGWGRRVCPGQHLAEQGTFLGVARLLWAFKIEPAIDEATGEEVPVDIFDYTNGLNWLPQPFKVRFTPRSPEIHKAIQKEAQQAEEGLDMFNIPTEFQFSTFYK